MNVVSRNYFMIKSEHTFHSVFPLFYYTTLSFSFRLSKYLMLFSACMSISHQVNILVILVITLSQYCNMLQSYSGYQSFDATHRFSFTPHITDNYLLCQIFDTVHHILLRIQIVKVFNEHLIWGPLVWGPLVWGPLVWGPLVWCLSII